MRKLALVPMIPAAACLALAGPALASTTSGTTAPEAVSENWAGYEVTPNSGSDFRTVSGGWTQPQADCAASTSASTSLDGGASGAYGYGPAGYDPTGGYGSGGFGGGQAVGSRSGSYAAFWVGLGGGSGSSDALEQDGTQVQCGGSGKARYYAWYELVPSAPVTVPLAVHAGDRMWASTAVDGDRVTFVIDNKTTGQSWSKTVTMTAATPDTSTAEWVAEAPSSCVGGASGSCTPLPLTDFGKVDFSDASVSTGSSTGAIAGAGWTAQPIALADEAAPGSLSANGSAFSVTYGASAAATQTGYGQSSGGGDAQPGAGGSASDGPGGGYSTGAGAGYGGSGAQQYGWSGRSAWSGGGQSSAWPDAYPGTYVYTYSW